MFIEFTTQDNKQVLLNKLQIVSIESENQPVVMGMQGGGLTLRVFATEGRVFNLDAKKVPYKSLREQLERAEAAPSEVQEITDGRDKGSPVR